MIAKTERRHMARAYGCQTKRIDGGRIQFEVWGDTPGGKMTRFIIDANFRDWSCLAIQFAKTWKEERESRINEITRIDAQLPKEPQS